MELQQGALFKIGQQEFEYVGTHADKGDPEQMQAVGRLHPEQPEDEGALHRIFPFSQLEQEGVKVGPFSEAFPYSSFVQEQAAWHQRFPDMGDIPHPPQALVDTLRIAKEQGITFFEAHFLPQVTLSKDKIRIGRKTDNYPAGWVKPNDWFFDNIGKKDGIPKESLTIPPGWILVDNTPKPAYENGAQMYQNDPLRRRLADLQTAGSIPTTSVSGSRFNISWDQRKQHIDPMLTDLLQLSGEKGYVTVPSEASFNVLGNMFHTEWGETNTYEWLNDSFGTARRLYGGDSDLGGLADVHYWLSDDPRNGLGFRPLVVFSARP